MNTSSHYCWVAKRAIAECGWLYKNPIIPTGLDKLALLLWPGPIQRPFLHPRPKYSCLAHSPSFHSCPRLRTVVGNSIKISCLQCAVNDELHITEHYKSSDLVAMRQHNDCRQSKCPTIFIYLMLTVTLDSCYICAMENADAHIEGFNSEAERLTQKLISAQQTVQQACQNLDQYTSGININTSKVMTSSYISQLERDIQQGERWLQKAQGDLDKATFKLSKLKCGSGRVEFNQVWIYSVGGTIPYNV